MAIVVYMHWFAVYILALSSGRSISHSAMYSVLFNNDCFFNVSVSPQPIQPSCVQISASTCTRPTMLIAKWRADLSVALTSEPEVFTTRALYLSLLSPHWPVSSKPNDIRSSLQRYVLYDVYLCPHPTCCGWRCTCSTSAGQQVVMKTLLVVCSFRWMHI